MKLKFAFFLLITLGIVLVTPSFSFGEESKSIETNFYFIKSEEVYSGSSPLLLANSGLVLFAGERDSGRILRSSLKDDNFTLVGQIPSPTEINHPDNKLLDMIIVANKLYAVSGNGSYKANGCGSVDIYEFSIANPLALTTGRQIFKSTPCVIGDTGGHVWTARLASDGKNLFVAGGNWLVDWQLGTYPWSGFTSLPKNSINLPSSNFYGNVVAIDLRTMSAKPIAKGLRNLGGLYFDPDLKILFNTDNGTRGGDELNVIKKSANYGWPHVTLGLPYGPEVDKGAKVNTQKGFRGPIFSWTPSISPSTIGKIRGGEFKKYWLGDLIIGSLKDKALHRIRLGENLNVLYDEKIKIGHRIRSHVIMSNGKIALGTDDGKILLVSALQKNVTGSTPEQG